MNPHTRAGDVVAEMLERSQMPQAEAGRRAVTAADRQYWAQLAPDLSVETAAPATWPLAPPEIDDSDLHAAVAQFQEDAYFQTPPLLPATVLAPLNRAVDNVVAEGWPPVFAWVYDEFWLCARLAAVARLLASRLGPGYAQIPHIWIHVVPGVAGAAGWPPHFDGFASGRASVWVALTAATAANGCMHVVPPRLLPPEFNKTTVEGSMPMSDAVQALQSVRALPAAPGSALGWGFEVYHWGGTCVKPGEARRAISMEFLSAAETPSSDELPLVPVTGPLPALSTRLRMIGQAIRTYEKFERGLIRYRAIADRLLAI